MHKRIQTKYDTATIRGKVVLLSQYMPPIGDIWFVDKVCCLVSSLEAMQLITHRLRLYLILKRALENSVARECLMDVGSIRSVVVGAIDRLAAANRASEVEKYKRFLKTLDDAIEPLIGITVGEEGEVDDEATATAPPASDMTNTWATHPRVQAAVRQWKTRNPDIYIHENVHRVMKMIEMDKGGLKAFDQLQNLKFKDDEPFGVTVYRWMQANLPLLARTPALVDLLQNVCPFYTNYPTIARRMYTDPERRNFWFGYNFEGASAWTDYWRDATFAAGNGDDIGGIQTHVRQAVHQSMPMRVVWYDNVKATQPQITEWKNKTIGLVLIGDSVDWTSTVPFPAIQFMHASGIGPNVPNVPNVVALELEHQKIPSSMSLNKARFIRLEDVEIAEDVVIDAPMAELVSIHGITGGGVIRLPKSVELDSGMVPNWRMWVPDGAQGVTADSLDEGLPSADFDVLQIVHGPVRLQTQPGRTRIGRLELIGCWDLHDVYPVVLQQQQQEDGELIETCVMRRCRVLTPHNLDFLYYCTSLTFDNTSVNRDDPRDVQLEYPHLARVKVLGIVPECVLTIISRSPRLVTLRLERAYLYNPIEVQHQLITVSVHELYGNAQINVCAQLYELDLSSLCLMDKIDLLGSCPDAKTQISGIDDKTELDRVFGEDKWVIYSIN